MVVKISNEIKEYNFSFDSNSLNMNSNNLSNSIIINNINQFHKYGIPKEHINGDLIEIYKEDKK